jgi:hypothetical protein
LLSKYPTRVPPPESEPGPGPTPPPFDSLANLRALGDIQRRGLEAANQVVGRLVDQVDRSGPLFGAEPTSGAASSGENPMTQYAELMSSFISTVLGAAPPGWGVPTGAAPSRPSAPAADGTVVADPLVVAPVPAGDRAHGELWLHNRSGAAIVEVRPHSGDLRRHDGWAVAAEHVTFEPDHIDELPDLTSRGVRVSIDVPEDTPAGVYRGTVLAANLPDVWLVLELTVLVPTVIAP